jgi:hypothetical protein
MNILVNLGKKLGVVPALVETVSCVMRGRAIPEQTGCPIVSKPRDNVVAMMVLNFLTLGGRTNHVDEVRALLLEAGFNQIDVIKLPTTVGATRVRGQV